MARSAATLLCVLVVASAARGSGATTRPAEPVGDKQAGKAGLARQSAQRRQALRRDSYTALAADDSARELDRAIRLAESIIRQKPLARPRATTRPAAIKLSAAQAAKQTGATTKPAVSRLAAALKKLKNLSPGQVPNAVALADALYVAGRTEAAATFYDKALDAGADADTTAWLLCQLGSCYKTSDPDLAQKYFRTVLADHGDSPWDSHAMAQITLIQWWTSKKPDELITKAAAKGTSN